MKKKILFVLLSLLLLPIIARADGSITVSKSNLTIVPGSKGTFVVKANSAAGRVDISSSNNSIVTVSPTSIWLDNDSKTISVSAKSEGTANITIKTTDVATYSGTVINKTFTVKVTVKKPEVDTRSTNNNLSSISVTGYEIVNEGNNIYSLKVKNNVSNITIAAKAEDEKATITGIGEKTLNVGDNNFEIIVTAENGSTKKYTLKVNRRDEKLYLSDIDDALKKEEPINIILDEKVIKKEIINKIIESKKTVFFDYYDNNKLVYSWVVNGKELSSACDLDTQIVLNNSNEDLEEKTNYAAGLSIKFNNVFSKGITSRIYVDKYKDNDVLKLYSYKNDSLNLIKEELKVLNGYVNIEPIEKEIFITKASISQEVVSKDKKNIFMIASLIELLIIIILVIILIKLRREKI